MHPRSFDDSTWLLRAFLSRTRAELRVPVLAGTRLPLIWGPEWSWTTLAHGALVALSIPSSLSISCCRWS